MNKKELHKLNDILFDNLDIEIYSKVMEYKTLLQQENKHLKERIDKYKHFIETTKENLELIEEDKIAINLSSLPKTLLKRIEELENGNSND